MPGALDTKAVPAPPGPEVAALKKVAEELAAFQRERGKGLLKKGYDRGAAQEFRRIFAPALPTIFSRFGRVFDKDRRVRTQPEEEQLMREACRAMLKLVEAGEARPLGEETAALAVLTFYVGDYQDALTWANQASKLDPDSPVHKLNGAVLVAEFREFGLAHELVNEVLMLAPDTRVAWVLKARVLQGLKLVEEARARDLEKKGKTKEAQEVARRASRRVEEAASALREVVRLDPKDGGAWYELGKFLYTHGRLDEASQAYASAVKADPALKLAWYQKGTVHQIREEADAAIEAFERGVALDTRDASNMLFRVAAMKALKGDIDSAFAWIERGLAMNKANFFSELYKIEFVPLYGDPRWEKIERELFEEAEFQRTKAAQAEVGFSWGLFEHGPVLFYDSLADAFEAAEAHRREEDFEEAREYYRRLVEVLERGGNPKKAALVRRRLESLPG